MTATSLNVNFKEGLTDIEHCVRLPSTLIS